MGLNEFYLLIDDIFIKNYKHKFKTLGRYLVTLHDSNFYGFLYFTLIVTIR